MKRIAAVLILAIALAAQAATVTLSTGASCPYNTVTISPSMDMAVQCVTSTCPPPQPADKTQACPPGQTGAIKTTYACVGTTWTPNVTNSCTASPPGDYTMLPTPPEAQGGGAGPQYPSLTMGTTYVFKLPVPPYNGGIINISGEGGPPAVGAGAHIEVAISKKPGDWAGAKAASVPGWGGVPAHSYYMLQGTQSAGMQWIPFIGGSTPANVGWTGIPYVPPDEQQTDWYFNFRLIDASGGIFLNWVRQGPYPN